MLLITLPGGKHYLIKTEDLHLFIVHHNKYALTMEELEEWSPPGPKEPLTKKEREAQPKEPLPLSRFEGIDE
jgi:hypothetical protein